MDIYSFGDDSFDDISDDEDMNPFAVGYIKECEKAKNVITVVRNWKASKGMPLNTEISSVTVVGDTAGIADFKDDIKNTGKAKDVVFSEKADVEETIVAVKPSYGKIGPKFGKNVKEIVVRLLNMTPSDVAAGMEKSGYVEIELGTGDKVKLEKDDVEFSRIYISKGHEVASLKAGELLVIIEK